MRALQRYLDDAGYDTTRRRTVRSRHAPQRDGVRVGRGADRERRGLARRAAHRARPRKRRRRRGRRPPRRRRRRRTSAATASRWPRPPPRRGEVDHRSRERDRHEAVQVRRRPQSLERQRATTAPARSATCCTPPACSTRPLDSSGFMSWGERGRGTWITIRANPGHAYMIVAGLRFDTSARRQYGQPLERADALSAWLPRAPPRRTLGGNHGRYRTAPAPALRLRRPGRRPPPRGVPAGGRGDPVRRRSAAWPPAGSRSSPPPAWPPGCTCTAWWPRPKPQPTLKGSDPLSGRDSRGLTP